MFDFWFPTVASIKRLKRRTRRQLTDQLLLEAQASRGRISLCLLDSRNAGSVLSLQPGIVSLIPLFVLLLQEEVRSLLFSLKR